MKFENPASAVAGWLIVFFVTATLAAVTVFYGGDQSAAFLSILEAAFK